MLYEEINNTKEDIDSYSEEKGIGETVSRLSENMIKLREMSVCSGNMGIRNANELIYNEIKKII